MIYEDDPYDEYRNQGFTDADGLRKDRYDDKLAKKNKDSYGYSPYHLTGNHEQLSK